MGVCPLLRHLICLLTRPKNGGCLSGSRRFFSSSTSHVQSSHLEGRRPHDLKIGAASANRGSPRCKLALRAGAPATLAARNCDSSPTSVRDPLPPQWRTVQRAARPAGLAARHRRANARARAADAPSGACYAPSRLSLPHQLRAPCPQMFVKRKHPHNLAFTNHHS